MTQTELQSARCAGFAPRPPDHVPRQVGPWELLDQVVEGGMSWIQRARPAGSDDHRAAYAVKLLKPPWQEHPEAVRRLAAEAAVGRLVSHPNLAAVLASQVGRTPRYLVMPWLEGRTLAARLADGDRPPLAELLWIVRQAAAALHALHRAGWMHGDVKPDNVMIAPTGHVTLLDLGFASRLGSPARDGDRAARFSADRCLAGTAAYMAPELLTSRLRADIRGDLYSLGATLYEALTGRPPLAGTTLAELAAAHRTSIATPLRHLAPAVPRDVAELVHALLSKDPMRRPRTPAELVDRLVRLEIDALTAHAVA